MEVSRHIIETYYQIINDPRKGYRPPSIKYLRCPVCNVAQAKFKYEQTQKLEAIENMDINHITQALTSNKYYLDQQVN